VAVYQETPNLVTIGPEYLPATLHDSKYF
jgi:hypothetical protein